MHTVITAPSLIIGEGRTRPADGIVVSTAVTAGGIESNHSEMLVRTSLEEVAA